MEFINKKLIYPTREEVKKIKEKYIEGTKIELIKMHNDPQPIPEGTKGIVEFVDDIGTIHIRWETGSGLGLIVGVDEFVVLDQ